MGADQRLVSTLRSLAEGVVAADFAGRVTFLNVAAERITGWSEAEALGRPLTEVFRISHPSGQAADFVRLGGARGGRSILLTTRQGTSVPIEDNTAPIRDADGSLAGLVILFRRREENTIPTAEGMPAEWRGEILEGIADPLFCLDAQWRFTYVNAPAAAAFGADRQSLIGRVLWNKFPPSVHRRHYQDFCAALLKRERRTFDLHEDGSDRWLEASIYPLHEGLLVLLRDVTEKKAAEEAAARLDRLESLGVLARGFAHDFNNLLTVILGNLSLAQMRLADDDPGRGEFDAARHATQQAQGLVQNLLTFARGGAPVRRRLKIEPLMHEVLNAQPAADNVSFRLALGPDLGEAEWDASQVRRVISNLLRNAAQSIPLGRPGDVLLRVFTQRLPETAAHAEPQAVIEVIDNGIGIPPEALPHLFEPYFTTRADQNASGLGLTVCESIVKAHGGRIDVRSQPGLTVFAVTLPALAGEAPAAAPRPAQNVRPEGQAARILVLEDEPLIRQLIKANLSSRGYHVEATTEGTDTVRVYREALERAQPFDLVILDLSIPSGQGGRETMEQLRALNPAVRAVVSSGYSDDAVMSRYMDYGFQAVLPKPYDPAELLALVAEVLEG